MRALDKIIENLIWKPSGFVPSLESLEPSHGVTGNWNVTMTMTESSEGHPLRVVELAGGKIIGNLRMVATAGDVLIGGLQSLPSGMDPQNHYLARRRRFRLRKFRRGTALLLGAANSDNYYHWMLDSVPRWKVLQAAKQFNYDFVLLHDEPVRFQDETLDRMGIPREKRLRCSKNFVHQFERLVVLPLPPVTSWSCSYVRSLFPKRASGPENIYLRRGPGRRQLVNEAELEAALAKIGFVSIEPGRQTATEQAGFLSSARCVVAPHGAALTNIIFAPCGALIVELLHPQYRWGCYPYLAKTCGHRCVGLEGKMINRANDSKLKYSVDVSAVLEALKQ
ncbi:MAG TPA: glycosyltransferase family 61 protein [Verrucomicrobiae bacterium]|nr:glycosyltransferase family 61 protein [Verrucomicrobiae bacterium]